MQIINPDTIGDAHEPFRAVIGHWYATRDENALPDIKKFMEMAKDEIPGYRMIAAVQKEPLSVQYFDVGEALEDLYGHQMSGKNLDELYNSFFRKRAYEGYRSVIAAARPVYETRSFSTIAGKIGYYKLHLPFGTNSKLDVITYIMPTERFKKRFDWESLIKKTPWM